MSKRDLPTDYIMELVGKGMSARDIAKKIGCARSSVYNVITNRKQMVTDRILKEENLTKIRESILGDKRPEDLIDLAKESIEVKINIVEQLTEINQSLVKELKDVENELRCVGLEPGEKDTLRDQKRKLATEIRAQQKFGVEIATFVKEMDFRRIVMEEINQESPQTAERIYARLRTKL
jgi:transposase